MSTRPQIDQLEKGQSIGEQTVGISRADLIRYAAASGDHNPIHWNDRFAREVGLQGVIAHGMLTMGLAADLVTAWAGDPAAVVDYQTRFTKPVPVPDAEAGSPETHTAWLNISGKVGKIDAEAGTVRVDLTVAWNSQPAPGTPGEGSAGEKVLAKTQAVVAL
ncbi:MaoC family dehydratase [Nesterenkonia alba]|uniref:MaoC family dehydratase n=1 Tax=Nesterenkonia alba TaxID=515814 RepID=UPI0003B3FC2B|nr:MaoC family dehydratase [Nesterenkonia alba]